MRVLLGDSGAKRTYNGALIGGLRVVSDGFVMVSVTAFGPKVELCTQLSI